MWFMPESYIWLVSVGRAQDAGRALRRMGYSDIEVTKKVSQAQLTFELSKQDTEGVTYLECFRKSNVRRTIISIMPMAIQALCGIYFVASYSTYYIQLTGVSTEESFSLQIVQQCLSMLGNIGSWYLVERVGRRSLTFWGLVGTTILNFLYGGLGSSWSNLPALKGSFGVMLAYAFFYNLSIGATAFTILTEVSTSRLRAKTISMGIALQYVVCFYSAFLNIKLENR
jgi:MFS transporter, SP family, general alpha glucoside:H+ symporter